MRGCRLRCPSGLDKSGLSPHPKHRIFSRLRRVCCYATAADGVSALGLFGTRRVTYLSSRKEYGVGKSVRCARPGPATMAVRVVDDTLND